MIAVIARFTGIPTLVVWAALIALAAGGVCAWGIYASRWTPSAGRRRSESTGSNRITSKAGSATPC